MAKVVKNYISGLGEIAFGNIEDERTKTFGITIGTIKSKPQKINSAMDVANLDETTVIWFKNIEGLEVLQDKIDRVRMELVKQNKLK